MWARREGEKREKGNKEVPTNKGRVAPSSPTEGSCPVNKYGRLESSDLINFKKVGEKKCV